VDPGQAFSVVVGVVVVRLFGFRGALGSMRGEDETGVEGREASALEGVSFCFFGGMGWKQAMRSSA
jgi:hypothetical protein